MTDQPQTWREKYRAGVDMWDAAVSDEARHTCPRIEEMREVLAEMEAAEGRGRVEMLSALLRQATAGIYARAGELYVRHAELASDEDTSLTGVTRAFGTQTRALATKQIADRLNFYVEREGFQ